MHTLSDWRAAPGAACSCPPPPPPWLHLLPRSPRCRRRSCTAGVPDCHSGCQRDPPGKRCGAASCDGRPGCLRRCRACIPPGKLWSAQGRSLNPASSRAVAFPCVASCALALLAATCPAACAEAGGGNREEAGGAKGVWAVNTCARSDACMQGSRSSCVHARALPHRRRLSGSARADRAPHGGNGCWWVDASVTGVAGRLGLHGDCQGRLSTGPAGACWVLPGYPTHRPLLRCNGCRCLRVGGCRPGSAAFPSRPPGLSGGSRLRARAESRRRLGG